MKISRDTIATFAKTTERKMLKTDQQALVYQAMHFASFTKAALLQRPAVVDAGQLQLLLVSGAGRASSALVARSRPGHRPWVAAAAAAAAAALAQVAERTGPCIDQLAKQSAANARSAALTPAAAADLLGGLAWRIGSFHRGAGRRADSGKPEFRVGSKRKRHNVVLIRNGIELHLRAPRFKTCAAAAASNTRQSARHTSEECSRFVSLFLASNRAYVVTCGQWTWK